MTSSRSEHEHHRTDDTGCTAAGAAVDAPTADAASFCRVRNHTEALAAPLGPEDQVVQSMASASPTKWHRAHTTWFFEEFVLADLAGHLPFDEAYRYLFNSYYEAVGPRQPRGDRGLITRPGIEEVARYRRHVDTALSAALREGRLDHRALSLVELGLHHEQQHQELLLMDALHLLAQNPTHPGYAQESTDAVPTGAPPCVSGTPGHIEHDGGLVEVGHDHNAPDAGFAYDNESPRHRLWVEPFALEDRLVTCGEWLGFIDDGGYQRPDLWLSDGWYRCQAERWEAPAYWHDIEGTRAVFGLTGLQPLDETAPVAHISYYEADAYARWRGARLPTESEWELVATTTGGQFFGALWQWTSSAYGPYPGFRPAEGAVGEYNGKFMVDQQVLRGSSFATPVGHARPTYRNFFPAASRWPFTGVRIARDP